MEKKYTYDHQDQKVSGVLFPAMLVQKNNQNYKMLSAEDIAWNVVLNEGTDKQTRINDTDDLLNYISELHASTETIKETNFSSYRIECETTVCYDGDIFDRSPEISVYKTVDGKEEKLLYAQIIGEGLIVNIDPEDTIIKFDPDGQYLNGVAHSGIYVLRLKRNDTTVASLQITVLNRPERVYSTVIYTESETLPDIPKGGSCDNELNFTPPIGWVTDVSTLSGTSIIWFSIGTVFLNSGDSTWSSPAMYITRENIQKQNKYVSKGVSVYKAISSKVLTENNGSWKLEPNTLIPDVPDVDEGSYEFTTNEFTAPEGWYTGPLEAIEAYVNEIASKITSEEDNSKKELYKIMKDSYKVYVSYNNYTATFDDIFYSNIQSTGWTSPIEYLNIDAILETAKNTSYDITTNAVNKAREDLNASLTKISGNLSTALNDIEKLQGSVSDFVMIDTVVNSLSTLYSWLEVSAPTDENNYTYKEVNGYSYEQFAALKEYTGKNWYDKYVKLEDGKYYKYMATSAELTTQLSALNARTKELETTVSKLSPDEIRLLASKGYLTNVTWTAVTELEYSHNRSNPEHIEYDSLPTNYYKFGEYYKLVEIKDGKELYTYYRCDYPISTGFLDVLSERVSLGIANNQTGDNKGANITFSITKEGDSQSVISSDKIVLDGDTIAAAVAARSLNIDGYTYLFNKQEAINRDDKAMAIFGGGTDGTTIFKLDGSGQLAGGNITWKTGENAELAVKGKIKAESGYIGTEDRCWEFGWYGTAAALFGTDSINNREIVLSTEYLGGGAYDNHSWTILNDGTATFANRNVVFNNDGSGYIGIHDEYSGETQGITIAPNGNISINGVDVTINASGIADLTSTIRNTVTGDPEIVGVIADAAAGQVDILGTLKTEDVAVGDGACFFKGSDKENLYWGYSSGTKGSGYLAKKNIKWDSNGNLSVLGNVKATTLSVIDPSTEENRITFEVIPEGGIVYANTGEKVPLPDGCPVMIIHYKNRQYITNLLEIGSGSTTGANRVLHDYYESMYVKMIYNSYNTDLLLQDPSTGQYCSWNMSDRVDKTLWQGKDGKLYEKFSTLNGVVKGSEFNGYLYKIKLKPDISSHEILYNNHIYYTINSTIYNVWTIYARKYVDGELTNNIDNIEELENTISNNFIHDFHVRKYEYGNGHYAIDNVSGREFPGAYVPKKISIPGGFRIDLTVDNDELDNRNQQTNFTIREINSAFGSVCHDMYGINLSPYEFCECFVNYHLNGMEPSSNKLRNRFEELYEENRYASTGEETEHRGVDLLQYNGTNETTINKLDKVYFTFCPDANQAVTGNYVIARYVESREHKHLYDQD